MTLKFMKIFISRLFLFSFSDTHLRILYLQYGRVTFIKWIYQMALHGRITVKLAIDLIDAHGKYTTNDLHVTFHLLTATQLYFKYQRAYATNYRYMQVRYIIYSSERCDTAIETARSSHEWNEWQLPEATTGSLTTHVRLPKTCNSKR